VQTLSGAKPTISLTVKRRVTCRSVHTFLFHAGLWHRYRKECSCTLCVLSLTWSMPKGAGRVRRARGSDGPHLPHFRPVGGVRRCGAGKERSPDFFLKANPASNLFSLYAHKL
jgi:hypothetical protein